VVGGVGVSAPLPYDAEHVVIVDMGRTVWALYIPDSEQAKDPQRVAEGLLRPEYADVELIATAERHYKKEGAGFSGWVVDTSDSIATKREAMRELRHVIRNHFAGGAA
jgi:hypothetical protein